MPTSQTQMPLPISSQPLRPYQKADVEAFAAHPKRRYMVCHPPGAGKTRIAIECARAIKARSITIVCPALARPVWVAEFQKWAGITPTTIVAGRTTKSITRVQLAAYDAPVRVISYGLLGNLADDFRWSDPLQDMVIFDEIHNLRSPWSAASNYARKFMASNPGCAALGLTATPIPTKTEQVWHPMQVLFPHWAGRPRVTGNRIDVPWSFLSRYCERIENEYGVTYTGPRDEEAMQQLHKHLAPYIRRVEPEVIEQYLPAVDAEPLYVDTYKFEMWVGEFAEDNLQNGIDHIAIVTYQRDTAQRLYADMSRRFSKNLSKEQKGVYYFTGNYAPEARAATLEHFLKHGGILVCTSESIRESIDLSFIKAALICEWRTSPAQALQLLGRFRRPNKDPRVNRVRYLTMPDDAQRAALLKRRLDAIAHVLSADNSHSKLQQVFNAKTATDDDLEAMLDSLVIGASTEKESWSCQS